MELASILWRRLDRPGHEFCRLLRDGSSGQLAGTAVFTHDAQPCRLDYRILCDEAFRTLSARVQGVMGERPIEVEISSDAARKWSLDGEPCPDVGGCLDVDLNFSPSTNLLPIRRLALPVGGYAAMRAAWLRFPSFTLEPLEQVYRRIGETTYRYESAGGRFTADLEVNDAGFVTLYPGLAEAESTA